MSDKITSSAATNDDLEPRLEAAVWAVLAEPVNATAIERVKTRALTLGNEPTANVRPSSLTQRAHRRWIQLAALAAGILVMIGASMLLPSNSNAFAQVIERLKTAGALRYKEFVYTNVQVAPVEVDVLVAADGRERRSMPGQQITTVHDASGQVRLSLIEANKSATVHERIIDSQDDSQRQVKWLEQLTSYDKNPDKQLGVKELEDRECIGFEVKLAQAVYSIWVDAKTNALVQVEFSGMPKGSAATKLVMRDFLFDVSLDPELFSFKVPKGYVVSAAEKIPALLPFEESLIEALKGYTELSSGKFPDSIADWGQWAVLLAESGAPAARRTTIATRLGTLLPYLTSLPKADYDYLGSGKTIGDNRTIVFWYRNSEKQIRAVFNDLTISDLSGEELKSNLKR